MRDFVFIMSKIAALSLVLVLFSILSWLGVMPLKAVQVFVNTLFIGAALLLMADIMLNTRIGQKQKQNH